MSVKFTGAYPTRNNTDIYGKKLLANSVPIVTDEWVRNPAWPECDAPAGSDKIVGLYAVYPGDGVGTGGNFFSVTVSGAHTIDYGDGTVISYPSGNTAYYEFNYNSPNLANTDAPVTFTSATSTVSREAHGYANGMAVRFYNIAATTELSENTPYYVINATVNTFQVSDTIGGSAITLTSDGSARLLPYKIAIITITPQPGQNITSVSFFSKHNQSGLVNGYLTGWLDIAIAGANITSLSIGSSSTNVRHSNLERVRLNQLGNITSFSNLFSNCSALRYVDIASSITTVTSTSGMFSDCYSLTSVPLFNTADVTNMSTMFSYCYSLTSVPLFNTAAVTNMGSMFSFCRCLTSVPELNTSTITSSSNLSGMFNGCSSLARIQAKSLKYTFSVSNCKLSAAALNEIYTNLPTVTGQTITVSGNYGSNADDPTIATSKGWTVSG